MEIILKVDLPKLGYANDIITVKNGYGRNYLIPQGYAVIANETNKKIQAENQRQKAFKEDKLRNEAEEVAKSMEGIELTIGAKAAQSGKIFGSVNNIQIAEALAAKNITIDRKKIVVDGDNIKEVGKYTATIHLHKQVKAEISFEVIAE